MRQGQQNKRMRGRNRKGPNPLTRSFESNGGDVKLRGTALHIAEKYVQLARDAQSSGDRVAAENYFQHAEHYYRIVAAAQAQMPQPLPIVRNDDGDEEDDGEFRVNGIQPGGDRQQGAPQGNYGSSESQPYMNGAGDGDDDGGDGGDRNDRGERYGSGGREQGSYRQGLDATLNRQGGQGGQGGQGNYSGQSNQGGQGNQQGGQGGQANQGGQGNPGGQGQFRRRRPFRERYDNNRNREGDRNGNVAGNQGERTERADSGPDTSSESTED
jgi:hypothetical protein